MLTDTISHFWKVSETLVLAVIVVQPKDLLDVRQTGLLVLLLSTSKRSIDQRRLRAFFTYQFGTGQQ